MELVLTVVVILFIRDVVEFFVKAMICKHVANEFVWIAKPAIIFCCLLCSKSYSTGRVIGKIVADCKTLPLKITI